MSECKYKPLFARVIIKREIQEKSKGGIIIPNAKKHAKAEGEVVAVGPTASEDITIGSHVIFGKHAGTWLDSTYSEQQVKTQVGIQTTQIENDDGTLFMCQDEDILAIIN